MRDSKTYPWVAFFYSEEFPRINVIRNPQFYGKNNVYLGPYTDKKEIQRILRDLRKIFPYCSCLRPVKKKKRPCLYFQLKLCPGPCQSPFSKDKYLKNLKSIEMFLRGNTEDLKAQIQEKMRVASEKMNFEGAAYWRDKLIAIKHSTTSQSVLMDQEENKDIVSYSNDEMHKYVVMVIIHIRDGRITNKSSFSLNIVDKVIKQEEILSSLMEQYYQDNIRILPDVIIVPELYQGLDLLKKVLEERNDKIKIRTPYNENEMGLLRISKKNAQVRVKQLLEMEEIRKADGDKIQLALEEARDLLDLDDIPRIIEGFDISNIEGKDATGSMVYFLEGKPYNKYYRHYKIRSKTTPDDVAMIKEVIRRRYTYLLEKNQELPDLILVDGGKGQLNAAVAVLENLGLEIPIIGLAKKFEEIHVPNKKKPIILEQNSQLLKIFQRIRDEAHRFAIRLQKKQRSKRITGSVLDDIKGVGPATRNKLLRKFGSIEGVKQASFMELSNTVGDNLARRIMTFFESHP